MEHNKRMDSIPSVFQSSLEMLQANIGASGGLLSVSEIGTLDNQKLLWLGGSAAVLILFMVMHRMRLHAKHFRHGMRAGLFMTITLLIIAAFLLKDQLTALAGRF